MLTPGFFLNSSIQLHTQQCRHLESFCLILFAQKISVYMKHLLPLSTSIAKLRFLLASTGVFIFYNSFTKQVVFFKWATTRVRILNSNAFHFRIDASTIICSYQYIDILLSGCAESPVETRNRIVNASFKDSHRVRYTCVDSSCDYEDTRPLFIHDHITPQLQLSR